MQNEVDRQVQSTIALYYNELMADFKNNEQAVFKKLNALKKEEGGKTAGEAAEEADKVRTWVRKIHLVDTCAGGPHVGR